jgi:hypothetical protein
MEHHVSIPTSFFLKEAKHEYFDYRTRLIAELLQNSLDAGATAIAFDFADTGYSCRDNGRGMTQERMVKALLTMGGSVKEANATGGFGAAKKLLLFAHQSFAIHSNSTFVSGAGLTYRFEDRGQNTGTAVSAVYDADFNTNASVMVAKAEGLLSKCDLSRRARVSINGVYFTNWLKLPHARTANGLGEVYASKTKERYAYQVMVRHNGLFMFERMISGLDRKVVLEVTGGSTDLFTQNRDGFRGDASTKFDSLVSELTADKNSVVKSKPRKFVLNGIDSFIKHISQAMKITPDLQAAINQIRLTGKDFTPATFAQAVAEKVADKNVAENLVTYVKNNSDKLQTDFHFDLADSSYTKVPWWLVPNTGKTKFTNLAALWKVCVREVLKANNLNQNFVVGFTLDSQATATHSMKNGVSCYMVNPKSKEIDSGTKQEKVTALLTIACHEVVHSQGCQYHDENFVRKFHDLLVPTLTKAPSWRQLVKMAKTEKV